LIERLPKSEILLKQSIATQNQFAACGGDDYELCFTAASHQRDAITHIGQSLHLAMTRIGQITTMKNTEATIELFSTDGNRLSDAETKPLLKSFDHFAS
jgi:thiamine-monophosphate kinase